MVEDVETLKVDALKLIGLHFWMLDLREIRHWVLEIGCGKLGVGNWKFALCEHD